MIGLALEGGGARGAYHVGVIKALLENGYDFDGFVGTSIGALNAAMMAQCDFEKLHDLWLNVSYEDLFDEDECKLIKYIDEKGLKPNLELFANMKETLIKIKDGGINTDKMKKFIDSHLDENKIRSSNKDFGLVTLKINELKPIRLMLNDIPHGQMVNYLMASASVPGFRSETIGNDKFIDGAFHDNCPYSLLLEKDYDEIIAIRTTASGIFFKATNEDRVKVITPKQNLGRLLIFTPQRSAQNIKLGYEDGLEFIKSGKGNKTI